MEDRTTGPGRAQGRDDRPRRIRALIRDLTADGHSVSELELDGLRVTLRPGSRVIAETSDGNVSRVTTETLADPGRSNERNISVPRGYRDRAREELRRRINDSEVNP